MVTDDAVGEFLGTVAAACDAAGREDLAAGLRSRMERAEAPAISVVVAGDFKAGKSSLVNALIGLDLCPVDDDVATAVPTLVRYADTPRVGGDPLDPAAAASVDVGAPSELLRDGLVLVDTPGVGGLGSQYTSATLSSLSMAHAVLFVSDATQEYTGPELDFLAAARQACPQVIPVLTKTDLAPHWEKVRDLDQQWLARAGIDDAVLTTAAGLAVHGRRLGRDDLVTEAGLDPLTECLRAVLRDGRRIVGLDGLAEARTAIAQLAATVHAELDAVADPATVIAELETAEAKARGLVGDSAEWVLILDDGITDLESEIQRLVAERVRAVLRDSEAAIARMDPADAWDDFEHDLARQVGSEMSAVSVSLVEGATALAGRVAEYFAGHEAAVVPPVNMTAIAAGEGLLATGGAASAQWRRALVEAGWGGVEALGALGSILTFTSISLFNPFSLVVGLFIGGRSWRAAKRRGLEQRREQAVAAVRQYLDDVAAAAHRDWLAGLRRIRRELRLSYQQRAEALHRTTVEALAAGQRAAHESVADALKADRTARLAELEELDRRAVALVGP